MCGLFGMAGPGISGSDLKIIHNLGIVSMLRGTDGAGVYQIRTRSQKFYNQEDGYKTWGNWVDLCDDIDRKKNNKLLSSVGVDVVMCHVRAATRGALRDDNSHPFMFEHIVGAHNGTLKDKRYEHPTKTDSELMFRDINNGNMEDVLESLDRDSAFAVSVFDRRTQTLRFSRNELRTLAFAFLADRGVMYWASEKDMLKYILHRAGEEATYFNLRPNKIVSIDPNQLTKKNIEDGPLKIMKCDAELNRPLPTILQKQEDARLEREAKEAAKAAKEAEPPKDAEPTNITTQTETKVTTQQMGKVVPFVPRAGSAARFSTASQYQKCSCGSKTLNLLDQNLAKRGKHVNLKYDPTTQTYSCAGCMKDEVQTG